MVRSDKDWLTFIRCVLFYVPVWLLLLVSVLGLLAIGLGFLLLLGLRMVLWTPLSKRVRDWRATPEIQRTSELVSEVLAAVERVKNGKATLPSVLSTLSGCRQETAWPPAAKQLVRRATEELKAEHFAEAFILARFSIALSDPLLSEDERFECRRILTVAQLPAGPLAKAQQYVIGETRDLDREADPAIWARTAWWLANLNVEKKPKDPAALAQATEAYTKVHKGLHGAARAALRAEALKRLAESWWKSRDSSARDRAKCEEKAICCLQRALTLLDAIKDDDFDWALIQRELGFYFYYRQQGERGSNLEESIARFTAAAERLRIDGPQFALTQHWLGASFLNRVHGDRARNLERAIEHLQQTRHVGLAEHVRKRTRELLDQAVKELWGPAADLVAKPSPSSSPDASANDSTDPRSLLPVETDLGTLQIEQRRPWWRWAIQVQLVTLVLSFLAFFLYFRQPSVWLGVLMGGMAIGFTMLAWNNPRAMENYVVSIFGLFPRLCLEIFRAVRAFKDSFFKAIFAIPSYLASPQSALPAIRQALAVLDEKRFTFLRLAISQAYGYYLRDNPVGEEGESCEEAILHLQSYRAQRRRKSLALFETVNSELLAGAYLRRKRGNRAENARVAKNLLVGVVLPHAELRSGSKNWFKRKNALLMLGEANRLEASELDDPLRRPCLEQAIIYYRAALACQRPGLGRWRTSRKARRGGTNANAGVQARDWEPLMTDAGVCFGLGYVSLELAPEGDSSAIAQSRSYLAAARAYLALAASAFAGRHGFNSPGMARKGVEIDLLLARLEGSAGNAETLYRRAAHEAMREGFPGLVLEALAGLGRLLYQAGLHDEVIDALTALIDYQDRIRWQVISIERRAELLRSNIEDFDRLISSLVRKGRIDDALALSERSRSRTLIDLLHIRGVQPGQAGLRPTHGYLLQATLLEHQPGTGDPLAKPLELERGSGDELYEILRDRHQDDRTREPDLGILLPAQPMSATAIKELAKRSGVILLLLRVTAERSFAFLTLPDRGVEVVETALFRGEDLDRIVGVVEGRSAGDDSWTALEDALGELSERLLGPIRDRLAEWKAGPTRVASRLVIVPNRGLAVLPLHACSWQAGGERRYLIDEFVVSYAPNLSMLASCLERDADRIGERSLFAIGNPQPNAAADELPLAEWECERIRSLAATDRSLVRVREAANHDEVVRQATAYSCVHFACHADYFTNDAFNSRILLANDQSLTFAEVLDKITLPHSWLISLSACETGRLDSREVADESLSLATGFLIAGAPTVWCTLWKIFDVPSALLMSKAYQILFSTGAGKCEALRDAQLWLRDVTDAELMADSELIAILDVLELQGEKFGRLLRQSLEEGKTPGYRRFSHPKAWAAYQSMGA